MKRNYFMLIGTLFLLLVVCEKEMADQKRCLRFMEKNSKSITILQVNSNSKFIDLTGRFMPSGFIPSTRFRLTELFVPIPGSGK